MVAALRIAISALLLLLPLAMAGNAHAQTVPCHGGGSRAAVMQPADGHTMHTKPSPGRDTGEKAASAHACCDLGSCSAALLSTVEPVGQGQRTEPPISTAHPQRAALSLTDGPPPRG